MIGIRVVAFRREDEKSRKLGIPVQCTHALDDIAVEDFECLAGDDDFAADKARTARRELLVNDLIELCRCLEGQTKEGDKLGVRSAMASKRDQYEELSRRQY